jgi:hypothetical protein
MADHRRRNPHTRAQKNVSTAFSHDPEVGVKWNLHRGCRANQAFILMLVSCIVVDRRLNQPAWQNRPFDRLEEADELLTPATLHAAANHCALSHVQASSVVVPCRITRERDTERSNYGMSVSGGRLPTHAFRGTVGQ